MNKPRRIELHFLLLLMSLIILTSSSTLLASVRATGSVGVQSYGYNDADNENHLWLLQTTRLTLRKMGSPLSFHFSGGYIGDNQDDFSSSGRSRFLKGYFNYGRLGDANQFRLGRFFLHRGVGIGTLDGVEFNHRHNAMLSVAMFAGLMSPLSREFELEEASDAFSAGGELKYTPGSLWKFDKTAFALSYAHQTRNGNNFRNRIGLTAYGKLNKETTLYGIVRLRPTGSLLDRAIGRLRYSSPLWNGMVEGGLMMVSVADYSWFNGFEGMSYTRIRFAVDRYLVPSKWGVGLEGSTMMSDKVGTRVGPVFTTPYGQAGYRFSFGDQPLSGGPWASVKYSPMNGLDAYASGSITTYEWEAFDIESSELISFRTGVKYVPSFRKDFTSSLEYQVYQTPQFTSDRRVLFGLEWRFDSARSLR